MNDDSHQKIYNITVLLAFCVVLAISMLRPTLFGQAYSPLGLGLLYIVTFIFFLVPHYAYSYREKFSLRILTFILCGFWTYSLFLSILTGESHQDFLIKAVIGGVSTSICFYVLFSDKGMNFVFFSCFAKFNSLLGWSIAITWALLFVFPNSILTIGHIDVVGYDSSDNGSGNGSTGDLLFPFSFYYGTLTAYGISRFVGIYRETGIAQLYFVWAFIYLNFNSASYKWRFGSLLGAVLCGSSAVVLSLFSASLLYFGFGKKMGSIRYLYILIIIVAFILVGIYLPGIGLEDKQETHGDSINDRMDALLYVINDFPAVIWGHGLYHFRDVGLLVGINAITSIYYYGIIGLVVICMSFIAVPVCMPEGALRYMTAVAPLFVTAMLTQPLIDSPAAFLLLYCVSYGEHLDASMQSQFFNTKRDY